MQNGDVKRCTRCSKLSLNCVFQPPATKRKRRRNETRIRELERKLDEIQHAVSADSSTAVLRAPQSLAGAAAEGPRSPHSRTGSLTTKSGPPTASLATAPSLACSDEADSLEATSGDPLAKGLLSPDLAEELYQKFCSDLAPLYPLILPPTSPSSWISVRKSQPALFRAILAAAASAVDPKLSESLSKDAEQYLAATVVVAGEKSLGIVQALLVLATWHHPPKKFGQLKFTQFAQMAATMVSDMRTSNDVRFRVPQAGAVAFGEEIVEASRTYLACYLLCSGYFPHRSSTEYHANMLAQHRDITPTTFRPTIWCMGREMRPYFGGISFSTSFR
jgi:hypothetical protein